MPLRRLTEKEKKKNENTIMSTGYKVKAVRRGFDKIKGNQKLVEYMADTFFNPDFDDNLEYNNEKNKAFRKAMEPIVGKNLNLETKSWCAALISNILNDKSKGGFLSAKSPLQPSTAYNPKTKKGGNTLKKSIKASDIKTASTRAVEFSRLGKNIFDSKNLYDENAQNKIKTGDIFVRSNTNQRMISDNSFGQSGGHVGIVTSVNDDGTINVLGGNQANSINVTNYDPLKKGAFRIQRIDEESLLETPTQLIKSLSKEIQPEGTTD